MTMLVAPISSRNQLGRLFNDMNFTGLGVEVGTHRGEFANILLQLWKGTRLYCIDPWQNLPEYTYQAQFLWGGGNRHEDYVMAKTKLKVYEDRCQLIKLVSAEAVKTFDDGLLDFVYLDGNHEPPYVEEDIRLWWPKIRDGGVLAGHDIICPGETDGSWGKHIQPVVLEFASSLNLDIQLIVEECGHPWSYLILKP